jgi:hypothetical protein
MHYLIDAPNILTELLHLHHLRSTCDSLVILHKVVASLRVDLRLLVVALPSESSCLLLSVNTENLEISILDEFLLVIRNFQCLGYHPHLPGAIKGGVVDLRLKGKRGQLREINIFNFHKFRD